MAPEEDRANTPETGVGIVPLKDQQAVRLREAILAGFDRNELDKLLRSRLGARLVEVAPSDTLPKAVVELIKWAEKHEKIEELVRAIAEARSQNREIQSFVEEFVRSATTEPAPRLDTPGTQAMTVGSPTIAIVELLSGLSYLLWAALALACYYVTQYSLDVSEGTAPAWVTGGRSWVTFGYLMNLVGVLVLSNYLEVGNYLRRNRGLDPRPLEVAASVFRSKDFWMALAASSLGLALILRAIGEVNLSGLALIALENGFVWRILIGPLTGAPINKPWRVLGPPAHADAATRSQDRALARLVSELLSLLSRSWAQWRAARLDASRPRAECRIEALAEGVANCVVDLAGTTLPIDLPASILERAGIREGDRFSWRIPPDGRPHLGDIARLSDPPSRLPPSEVRRVDRLYERYRDVTSEELRGLLEDRPADDRDRGV
jgi:hypothetical protein